MPKTLSFRALTRSSVIAAGTAAAGVLAAPAAHADTHDAVDRDADRIPVGAAPAELLDLLHGDAAVEARSLADREVLVHEVEHGETLADIAALHGIGGLDGWRRLFDANDDIEDPNLISPGEEIRIPSPDEELERRELPALTASSGPEAPSPGSASDGVDSEGGSSADTGTGDAADAGDVAADTGTGDAADTSDNAADTGASTAAGGGVWDRLAQCEASGDWSANTGNGYSGGLQFHPQTWTAHGGQQYAPAAHQATRAQQIAVAERVLASQGWGAWPSCSRQLGLR